MGNILSLKDIGFKAAEQKILAGITFEVEQEAYLTITGPSGGGKSTLLKIIASLLSPTSGQILYEGQDQALLNAVDYRRKVSYCFQQPTLFGSTVLDNLQFPFLIRNQDYDEKKVVKLLEEVALSKKYLQQSILEISGGERQRVALIRNLIFEPKILLLDEVTTGLDEASKQIVQELIQNVNQKGITILQVTHDREEIDAAKTILEIQKGGMVHESAGL